jgi:hypothetical protein
MAGELITQIDPGALYRESTGGYDLVGQSVLVGTMRGVSLQKVNPGSASGTPAVAWEYYNFTFFIPTNLTITTGLTFYFQITDDGSDPADLGKVVKLGVTAKKISTGTATPDLSTGAGAEQTQTVTLSSTTQQIVQWSLAVANANLNSAGAGDAVAIRIRRMGADAADTCNGRVVLLNGHVKNT